MSATKELMDTLHRLLAEGLITEFKEAASTKLAPERYHNRIQDGSLNDRNILDNQTQQRHQVRNGEVPAPRH